MSDVIDTNIVDLKFNSNDFVNGVNHSIMAVDALKESLVFDSKSFDSLSKAANNIDLSTISAGVEALSQRFSTFGIVGMTAVQRITNAVIDLGGKFVGLLAKPWKQILTGGWSRASNIGQATFQLEGLFGKSEEGVAKLNMTMKATGEQVAQLAKEAQGYSEDMIVAMNAADYAVADTAYGLDSAAKAASVLATSGVDVLKFSEDLKDANGQMRTQMQVALRSISGVAAMANASYDDIAHVFERVSGNGRIMAIDLQSLSARGLNAAATLRDYLNEIGRTANATEADIREMVSKGEIDFMTFALAMDNAYGDHAKDANNTFSGAFSNMKFALSKIGADFITPIRNKMVPLFNDVRIAINNVRKALNYKIKIPGLEEEISLVEAFSNLITNLTAKAHEFFVVWNGGQNALEQGMSGFTQFTGVAFSDVKGIYDAVANGAMKDTDAISKLIEMATKSGHDMRDVFKTLSETLGKTEDEIYAMCYNGQISFEEFSNAVSATFGNLVQETRIGQLAQLFNNFVQIAINLAKVVTTTVGPIIWAFFKMFAGAGVHNIIDATGAFAEFTKQLHFSRDTQYQIFLIATKVFNTLKGGIKIVAKLASSIFKVAMQLAPLIDDVLSFIDVIASIVEYIVNIVVESNLLTSIVTILGKAFQVAGTIIVNVLRIIFSLVGPAIKGIGEVFAFLARSIGNIDLGFLEAVIDRLGELVGVVANSGTLSVIQSAIRIFFGAIVRLFSGVTLTFQWLNSVLKNVGEIVANLMDRIITTVKNFKDAVVNIFTRLYEELRDNGPQKLIALVGQLIGFTVLVRFAQGIRGLGRAFGGLGNILNSNALLNFMNAVKTLARAVLEFAVAMVLISAIPRENLETTIRLFRALMVAIEIFVVTYLGYSVWITKINTKVQADPLVKFMNKLNASLNSFFTAAGRATIIASVALLLISLAASFGFFIKAIQNLASINTEVFETGAYRLLLITSILTLFLAAIAFATRPSLWGNFNDTTINTIGGNGMMGAAVVLMALLVVIRAFETVLIEYNGLKLNDKMWERSLYRIISVMAVLVLAISAMGLTVKRAGFGLMGSVVVMMGFLIVLNQFTSIIGSYVKMVQKYRNQMKELDEALTIITGIIMVMVVGISAIGFALSAAGGTTFDAALKGGIHFQNNSAKFIGVMLTLLAFALVLQTVSNMMATISLVGLQSAGIAWGIIATILGALAGSLALIRGVKVGSIIGVAVILFELATILPLLTVYEPSKLLAGAESLGSVIITLAIMFRVLDDMQVTLGKALLSSALMGAILAELWFAFALMQAMDPVNLVASGIALAAVIGSFGIAFMTINSVVFNPGTVIQMAFMLGLLATAFRILMYIPNFDPNKLTTIVTCISILGVAMSIATRLMSGTIIVNGVGIIESMVGIAIALSILAIALVEAANHIEGNLENIGWLATYINLLIPIIMAMSLLSLAMSKVGTISGVGMIALIAALVAGLVTVFSIIGTFADVEGTIKLIDGIGVGLLKLTGFLTVLSVFAVILGSISSTGVGAAILGGGLAWMTAMLTIIAGFVGMIAIIATLGDANSTAYLLGSLGTTLDAMVPFLLKMGAISALLGVLSPLMIAGSVGFAAVFAAVSAFVGMIAVVSQIGNPEDTVTVLNGLITAMDAFNDFMSHFMLVLTVLGIVAPLAIVGSAVLNMIFNVLVSFTASMATIGTTGNVGNTLSVMTTLVDSMRELVNVFSIVMVLGALGVAVLTGMILITTSVGMLLTLSLLIGQIGSIKDAIINGVSTILYTAESMLAATEAMSDINVGAIANFIFALSVIALSPMQGLFKFAQLASIMTLMGVSSIYISRGSEVSVKMLTDLSKAARLIKDIVKTDTKNLVSMSRDILLSAANISAVYASIGGWVGYSLADGALSDGSLGAVIAAGAALALAMEMAVRNTAQIHSESPLYNMIGSWFPISMGNGALDNVGSLLDSGTNMMSQFGTTMFNQSGSWGMAAGGNFIVSLEDTLVNGLKNSGINDLYQYFANGVITEHVAYRTGMDASGSNTGTNITNTVTTDVKFRGNFQNYEEYLEWEKNHPNGDDSDINLGFELPDFADLEKWLEGLKESFNLGAITDGLDGVAGSMDGIGESAGAASSKTDELTKKIEDLMDEYEHLFENAKKNANKDLFKGVDDQGDDFLDSVNDIMKQYEDIYKSAVERTNGQNLFAEVNEENESFAPETLLNNLEDQVNQVNELNTIIASLSGRITDNNLRAAISNMDVDDLPQLRAMYRMTSTQLGDYEKMYQEKVMANQNKIQNELTGSLSQLTGEYTNVASYIATDASTDQLITNLQAQIDQLNEYNDTVASLMLRITDLDLREAIAQMGVEALPELKRLNAMNDGMLNQYQAMYRQKIAAEAVNLKNELSAQLSAAMGQPLDIDQFYVAYKNGMAELVSTIKDDGSTLEAGKAAGSTMAAGAEAGMKENFNEETAKQTGRDYTIALAAGMRDPDVMDQLETTVEGIISMIIEPLQDAHEQFKQCGLHDVAEAFFSGIDAARLSFEYTEAIEAIGWKFINTLNNMETQFYSLGINIIRGMTRGMNESSGLVSAAASKIAAETLNIARSKLGIRSPSREFMQIGRYVDEGFAIGLREYSNLAEDASSDMATGTLSPVQEAIQQLSGMLDGSIDINPVITPTLDLSQINARSAALANMFNGRQIAVQARADEQQAEMMTQIGNILAEQNSEPRSVTFNQTNNSPKALSRTEIYRQTRNGFSQLVSALS